MKLAVVGGGSTYTPELIDVIAGRRTTLDVDEIVLIDPDTYRVDIVGEFGQRLLDHAGHPARIRTTSNLEEGVDGASARKQPVRAASRRRCAPCPWCSTSPSG